MTEEEFKGKHNLRFADGRDEACFFSALDDLYLKYTKKQALELVGDYYDNADDIFNDRSEKMKKALEFFEQLSKNK